MATFLTGAIVRQDHNTTRRGLLRGSAAIATVGAGMAAPALAAERERDAKLIRMCGEFTELDRQQCALYNAPDAPEDNALMDLALAPINECQGKLIDRICATPTTTLEGVQAKARSLLAFAPEMLDDDDFRATWDYRLVASILSDLAGGGSER